MGKANEKMLSETENKHPKAQTSTSNRRGTQILEKQIECGMIHQLFFLVIPEKEQPFQSI